MVRLPFNFDRYHLIPKRSTGSTYINFVGGLGVCLVTWHHLKLFMKDATDRKRMELYEDIVAISNDEQTQQDLLKAYGFTEETLPKK